jgi:hypothetical protein
MLGWMRKVCVVLGVVPVSFSRGVSPRGACGVCALVADVSEGNKGRRLSCWLCLRVLIWVHGWVVPARTWRWCGRRGVGARGA